jgi:ubiquitin-conjugating enzyme E2 D/E
MDHTRRRLEKELKSIEDSPPEGCWAHPDDNDIFTWKATIQGPPASPYAGGTFHLSIHYPQDYPQKPPDIKFLTKIYHPNIDESGYIDLNILTYDWCPALTISPILVSLQAFLSDPDPRDAVRSEVARVFEEDRKEFGRLAREWTQKFATSEEGD